MDPKLNGGKESIEVLGKGKMTIWNYTSARKGKHYLSLSLTTTHLQKTRPKTGTMAASLNKIVKHQCYWFSVFNSLAGEYSKTISKKLFLHTKTAEKILRGENNRASVFYKQGPVFEAIAHQKVMHNNIKVTKKNHAPKNCPTRFPLMIRPQQKLIVKSQ